jgi:leader peptidase (prepilin peptidase)/N-methyltransferase
VNAAALPGWLAPVVLGAVGLLVGGVMNRVIERLPHRLERAWWADIAAQLDDAPAWPRVLGEARPQAYARIGHDIDRALARPAAAPGAGVTPSRRVAVALLTGGLFAAAAWRFGAVPSTLAWCAALALIVALAMIDLDTRLLPDGMTLSLLWGGLVASALGWTIPLPAAVWGAVAGFLALAVLAMPFKWATGREGMAAGDFKLLAALGAWLGWQAVLPIALAACAAGAFVGLSLRGLSRRDAREPIPFGPFLAAGALLPLLAGTDRVLGWIGLA